MAAADKETRDRVRELVKQVLATVPTEDEAPATPDRSTPAVEHVVVNSLQERHGREYDRDESAKTLLTEDDLRGLEPGARLRVAENVRFTPLAQDIADQLGLELIRKQPPQRSAPSPSVPTTAVTG